MHNELTQKDLELMRKELDHRRIVLRPQLLEAVKEARAFGDLSENFEYKAAKQEKNRNESRIRFLDKIARLERKKAKEIREKKSVESEIEMARNVLDSDEQEESDN